MLLPNAAAHLSGKCTSKPRWWESWTAAVLPAALCSDRTYCIPSQHHLGWIEATWNHPLLHPAYTQQTSPETFHSGQCFHSEKDKRDALGGEQCQLKSSGREMTTQATPQAAEDDRSSNVASFPHLHKRWEQSHPSRACAGEAFQGIGCPRRDAVPCQNPSQSAWTTKTLSQLQWCGGLGCSLRLGYHRLTPGRPCTPPGVQAPF